jgi:hypothetical protein
MSTVSSPIADIQREPIVIDDGAYDYFFTLGSVDVPIPQWLAEIVDVPLIVRFELFLFGFCSGLIIAATTLLLAIYVTVG